MCEERYLTLALTKGRLAEQTLGLFEKIGITCEEMKDKHSRKLIFVSKEHLRRRRGRRHRGGREGYDFRGKQESLRGARPWLWEMPYVRLRPEKRRRAFAAS